MTPQSGLMVTENLRLVRQIGEGGMGTVWVAEHLTLDTEVAVKFMAPELASQPDAVARFTCEAKSAARMRSPHVVKIFDYGVQAGGVPYMTMELLEGEDLEERVARAGRLSAKETLEVVTQLSKALSEAHAYGVVHRDIKPDNVFLMSCGDDFFVKVLDFGIAKSIAASAVRVTCSGTTIGTPIYMSPEQILSAKDVDYRCDLWSLAVVAYHCLTGRVPFEGETFGAVCISIDRGRLRAPSELRSDIPVTVDEWFSKALARDIGARFRSAKEMADAFALALGAPAPSRSFARTLSRTLASSFGASAAPAARRVIPLERQRTVSSAPILASSTRTSSRRHLTTFASVAAMLLLVVGAMDLGRTLFARDAHEPVGRTVVLTSPSLAYAEATRSTVAPPRGVVAPNVQAAREAVRVEGAAASSAALVLGPANVMARTTPVVAAARPMVRASEGSAWPGESPRIAPAFGVARAAPAAPLTASSSDDSIADDVASDVARPADTPLANVPATRWTGAERSGATDERGAPGLEPPSTARLPRVPALRDTDAGAREEGMPASPALAPSAPRSGSLPLTSPKVLPAWPLVRPSTRSPASVAASRPDDTPVL